MPRDVARRMALAAQGFAAPRPAAGSRVDRRRMVAMVERIGLLQLDSVNVVCRSHYLPLFARLGPYSRSLLDELCWGRRRALFEYWGHQASLLPLSSFPLLRWRMTAAEHWDWTKWSPDGLPPKDWSTSLDPALRLAPWAVISGMARVARETPSLVDDVLELVRRDGPIAAGDATPADTARGDGDDYGTGTMWNWKNAKIALEWLFYRGAVSTASRRHFERLYDLTERVLPAAALSTPAVAPDDAQRELVRIAARALGVATEKQLRQYFQLPADPAKARVAELVAAGELVPVRVEGVSQAMFRWSDAPVPDHVHARALLSPFDSLIWDRDRTLKLFGFHYRISIYTPEPQRVHGYYVLPFLLGDRLVARVDLRADRKTSTLTVPVVHREPDATPAREVAAELAEELRLMATWLELDHVQVADRGDLAPALAKALH
ncbi:winged helix-turn-helix domain-containing protein [Flindersiella endophytica]